MTTGTTDGVSAATSNLYWPWESTYGSVDDPLVPLPPSDPDYSYGFGLDAAVGPQPYAQSTEPGPQLTLVYGFADSTTEATSLLNAAGATTRATSDTHYGNDNPITVLAGVHRNN